MRTRQKLYPSPSDGITFNIHSGARERKRSSSRYTQKNGFDSLHDELLLSIMVSLSTSASSPSDLINAMLVCKRFCVLGIHPQVLAFASLSSLPCKASQWSLGAHHFLYQCAHAGNTEACFILGMIRFYCLQDRKGGARAIAKAAMYAHPIAMHSLAVIHFNGSGGVCKDKDKDLTAGVAYCAQAALLGHVDALRELGHCFLDGYGVKQNLTEGRRLLLKANAHEVAATVAHSASPHFFLNTALMHLATISNSSNSSSSNNYHAIVSKVQMPNANIPHKHPLYHRLLYGGGHHCPDLLREFGCNVAPTKAHVAHRFLVDWFQSHSLSPGLCLCSQSDCGRPETREREFRRCSACRLVSYCSRACQALDWKRGHKLNCAALALQNHNQVAQLDHHQIAFYFHLYNS